MKIKYEEQKCEHNVVGFNNILFKITFVS